MHELAAWLGDVLAAALEPHGYGVVELPGWERRGNGILTPEAVVWHHDASAPGYSPGMPDYLRQQVDDGEPGANIEVTLDGTWHLIAAGMTYHAGAVLPGMPGNARAIGVETDHTTGETWSGVALLDSLRIGTAAIVEHLRRDATALHFHKTICKPVGRKNDPDGLDLSIERRAVAVVQGRLAHTEDDDMFDDKDRARLSNVELRLEGVAQAITELGNSIAGYATVDGKRADGIAAKPKKLSFIGEIGKKLGLSR